jgi:hypothetical protein
MGFDESYPTIEGSFQDETYFVTAREKKRLDPSAWTRALPHASI